jgi:DNA-binding GntR family transcriptional regulator
VPSGEERERPYLRIAAVIRHRITTGALRPGDRVPSTRQVVRDFGVAMATAARALAVLRDEGLVVTRAGSGTIVRAPTWTV